MVIVQCGYRKEKFKMRDYQLRTTVGVDFHFTAENEEDAKKELGRIVVQMCSVNGVYWTSLEPDEIEYLLKDYDIKDDLLTKEVA
jgi:hypothetical protein